MEYLGNRSHLTLRLGDVNLKCINEVLVKK